MMYDVTIIYIDNKASVVQVEEPELEALLTSIQNNHPFYGKDKLVGFVTPATQVRYAYFNKTPEKKEEVLEPRDHMD